MNYSLLLTAALISATPELKIMTSRHNPLVSSKASSGVTGTWHTDPAIALQMLGKERTGFLTLNFSIDKGALEKLSEKSQSAIQKMNLQVYVAGYMRLNDSDVYPFVVSSLDGFPILVYAVEKAGSDQHLEMRRIVVVLGASKDRDLLFLSGGDAPNSAFYPYVRVTKGKEQK